MKRLLLLFLSIFIGIVLFFKVVESIGWDVINDAFSVFTVWQCFVILFLSLFVILVSAWRWQIILKSQNIYLPFKSLLSSYLIGFGAIFFAPLIVFGGEAIRGYALKKKNSVPWIDSLSSIFVDKISEWIINLIIIFFSIIFFLSKAGFAFKDLLIFFGVFIFFATLILFFYIKSSKKESIIKILFVWLKIQHISSNSFGNKTLRIEEKVFEFFKDKKAVFQTMLLSLLKALIMLMRVWILILFLGKNIKFFYALCILGFSYLAATIPIPAALGSHEAIQIVVFQSFGLGGGTATAFTMIIRIADAVFALLGVLLLFKIGFAFIKNVLFKDSALINNSYDKNRG